MLFRTIIVSIRMKLCSCIAIDSKYFIVNRDLRNHHPRKSTDIPVSSLSVLSYSHVHGVVTLLSSGVGHVKILFASFLYLFLLE